MVHVVVEWPTEEEATYLLGFNILLSHSSQNLWKRLKVLPAKFQVKVREEVGVYIVFLMTPKSIDKVYRVNENRFQTSIDQKYTKLLKTKMVH